MVSKRLFSLLTIISILILIASALPVLAQEPEEVVEDAPVDEQAVITDTEESVITDTVDSDPEGDEDADAGEDDELSEDEIVEDDGEGQGEDTGTQDNGNTETSEGNGEVVSDDQAADSTGVDDVVEEVVEDLDATAIEEEEVILEEEIIEAEAGDIEAAAVPGTFTSEFIHIQNLGSGNANVSLELYQNGAVQQTINRVIATGAVTSVNSSAIATSGAYAGVVSSDENVAVAVLNSNTSSKLGDSYLGFSGNNLASAVIIPGILRNWAGFNTTFYIQDASGATTQTVTIEVYRDGSTSPDASAVKTLSRNSTLAVPLSGSEFNGFGSYFGYARIIGTGNIAVVADIANDAGLINGAYLDLNVSGVAASSASTTVIGPGVLAGWAGFNTGINIINVGGTATTVTVQYKVTDSENNGGGQVHNLTSSLGVGASKNYNMAAEVANNTVTAASYGGIEVTSTSSAVIVLLTFTDYNNFKVGFASTALNPIVVTNKAAVPIALNFSGWNSGVTIYSTGGSGNIKTTWVGTNGTSNVVNAAGTNGTTTSFNAAALVAGSQIPANFVGAVFIEAEGAGQNILVISQATRYGSGYAAQFLGQNY